MPRTLNFIINRDKIINRDIINRDIIIHIKNRDIGLKFFFSKNRVFDFFSKTDFLSN